MKITGAQILMKVLQEENIDIIFGYPGGVLIDIHEELAKTDITHVLVRHEQDPVQARQIPLQESPQHLWIPYLLLCLPARFHLI